MKRVLISLLRNKYLIIVGIIISFSILTLITNVNNLRIITINSNNYFTKDANEFFLQVANEKDLEKLKKVIKETNVTEIKTDDGFTYYYFNPKSSYKPFLVKNKNYVAGALGVYLGEKEYVKYNRVVMKKYIITGNNNKLKVDIFGYIKNSEFDFKENSYYLIMNFGDEVKNYNGIYKIEGNNSLALFKELEEEKVIKLKPLELSYFDTAGDEFKSMKFKFYYGLILVGMIVLILISKVWWSTYSEELRVREIFGGNKNIIKGYFVFKYVFMISLGLSVGFLLFRLIKSI
ncbi:MAG: hypothetical protein PHQ32_05735 [Firmicutes bacterium]|nr:hypothetical protein [Bacillota bacterium]